MTKYTSKEAVATHCNMDYDEMNDYRYQSTMWTMPVWSFGDANMYSARPVGSKKTPVNRNDHLHGSQYNWKPVETWKTWEVLQGTPVED